MNPGAGIHLLPLFIFYVRTEEGYNRRIVYEPYAAFEMYRSKA